MDQAVLKMNNSSTSLFYVTTGRGTEEFAMKEIKNKLSAHIITSPLHELNQDLVRDGKIFFSFESGIPVNLEEIFKLKSVERIFVAIKDYENTNYFKGKRLFLDKLMDEVSCEENYSFAQSVLQQLISLSCKFDSVRLKTKLIESKSNGSPKAKKARLSSGTGDESESSSNASKREHEIKCLSCDIVPNSSCNHNDLNSEQTYDSSHNQVTDGSRELGSDISFRLSIKCSGRIKKWLNIKKLSKDLAWRVVKVTGWAVDLHSPMYEMSLHISDHYVTMGIPLTRLPLSRRKFVYDPGLRGPIAWIMTDLAQIQAGETVLDPMCGKGTLLLESCSELQEVIYIGVDKDLEQLQSAVENAKQAGLEKSIHFLQADALGLPLKSSSVSAVVCDAPFNQKHFTSIQADHFYFSFLSEMARVLQMNGNLVLLTSQELSDLVVSIIQNSGVRSKDQTSISDSESFSLKHQTEEDSSASDISLELLSQHNVKLGETLATILMMKKIT